jgi:hypothetical protein
MDRPRREVADVFGLYGQAYARVHPLSPDQSKTMRAIVSCRTAAMGGHADRCDACGFERLSYNSCRNRHCPKCQSMAKAEWLDARRAELLPVGYYHAVFTLPHEINPLALYNKKVLFDLLFRAAAETLQEFGQDPKHRLGGKIGLTALLHTWDQRLRFHVHLHCLIPGGALCQGGARWISAADNFLFPVKALAKVFRGKYIASLKAALKRGVLRLPPAPGAADPPERFDALLRSLWKKPWIVYLKKPFAGPDTVLDYLGRYTHRVAISNHRILNVAYDAVSFTWRDRADGNRRKVLTLPAEEFIGRFLLHVLPKGFVRCRHYGFLAARAKGRDLPQCRRLLGLAGVPPKPPERSAAERLKALTGLDLTLCPHCRNGTMRFLRDLTPIPRQTLGHPRPFPRPPDTS